MLSSLNRFVVNPTNININRSVFNRNSSHKTTFNSGDLVPIFVDEVLPGDTFNLKTSFVLRNLTPLVPVMDNSYIDFFYFFVPSRIIAPWVGDDWEVIQGANKTTYWAQSPEKSVTGVNMTGGCKLCSVANYMGVPIVDTSFKLPNPYPLIAYYLIWDEHFRDENSQAPTLVTKSSSNVQTLLTSGGTICKSNKFHDLFTSCLPSPQKGPAVTLGLTDVAPVFAGTDSIGKNNPNMLLKMKPLNYNITNPIAGVFPGSGASTFNLNLATTSQGQRDAKLLANSQPAGGLMGNALEVSPNNLWADLSQATATTINELRQAFAIQKLLERDARGGTRYNELLKSHFGVDNGDNVLQRPEYLGGCRIPINVSQVLQTSQSSPESPLGFTGAFSNTSHSDNSFVKSFKEFGYIIGVATIRTLNSYSQGMPKLFTRSRRFDFYYPEFANIGEQPIFKSELVFNPAVEPGSQNDPVFGYQEAWAHYRFKPSLVTGALAPLSKDKTFVPWTYTSDFNGQPTLNAEFLKQSDSNIAKTLVDPTTKNQFLIDTYFDLTCVRPMPVYSIPGLIDHH